MKPRRTALAAAIAGLILPLAVRGADDGLRAELESQRAELEALRRRIVEQEWQLRRTRDALDAQRRALDARLDVSRARGEAAARASSPSPTGAGSATSAAASANAPGQAVPAGAADGPVGQAPAERRVEVAPIFQQPGVLTARGKMLLEPSLQYAHANDNRVAVLGYSVLNVVLIGALDIRRINRDSWTAAVTARYGLTNRSELELRVPYVYRREQTVTRPATASGSTSDELFDASASRLGDIEMTGRLQLNEASADRPIYVASLRLKSRTGRSPFGLTVNPDTGMATELPTGSGFYGIQPGITALMASDPAVFFGGMSYSYNIPRDPGGGLGRVIPGNIFGFNFGMGLALNERATFSIGYDHNIVGKAHQADPDNATVRLGQSTTAQLGTLLFGVAYRTVERRNINLSLGVGVTREAPNVQLTLRVPTTF